MKNIFNSIRSAAKYVAVEFAEGMNLEVDLESADLVRFPGAWRGLWVFNAVDVGGYLKQVSVMMEPGTVPNEVRLMSPGIVRRVNLDDFKARVGAAIASRPKSQGQTVSDACYENWKAEKAGREAFSAVVGCTGAPAPQPENWPAGRPFPHQAE